MSCNFEQLLSKKDTEGGFPLMVSSGRGFHTMTAGCIPDCVAISSIQEAVEWSVWAFQQTENGEPRISSSRHTEIRDQYGVWNASCTIKCPLR